MVSGFGSLTTAVNLVATTLCMRCRGMTLMRMPLMVWMMLIVGVLVLTAILLQPKGLIGLFDLARKRL